MTFLKAVASMLRRALVYLCAAMAGLIALTSAAAADPVFPPGLRIGLEPPGDLRVSTRFPGFEDVDRKVSVAILDLPASAYPELESAAFSKLQDQLQQAKRESFPFGSGIGFLISGVMQHDGVTLHRWSLLAQSVGGAVPDLTTLINVEVPESALATYSDAVVRKALASVTFRPAPIQEQLGLLPFKFRDLAGFEVVQVMPTGVVILADKSNDHAQKQSLMIVSIGSNLPTEASDRARFARDLLSNAPVRNLTMQSAEPMRISGAPGHEIRAQGVNPGGQKVSMVQWLRFGSGGYLRIVAVSPTEDWDAMFVRFRTVRDGIDLR
jgi:hypothetical protein